MNNISNNTKAILLLTAPLLFLGVKNKARLLTPKEYKLFAKYLRSIGKSPEDLLFISNENDWDKYQYIQDKIEINTERLKELLSRGVQLSQALSYWHERAIWVVSRADSHYPAFLKNRLKEDAPAILYGCGNIDLLERGGIAIIGSRNIDQEIIKYTEKVAKISALADVMVISGGAKGVDQTAMQTALINNGQVCGVLADSLEKSIMNRDNRNAILDNKLVLISPYDPKLGFNVGNAMQRNKLIYALANISLVVNSDINKGGTWSGAIEQLSKYNFTKLFIRSTGKSNEALVALSHRGAIWWPELENIDEFIKLFDSSLHRIKNNPEQIDLLLLDNNEYIKEKNDPDWEDVNKFSNRLIESVQGIIKDILVKPRKEKEISTLLNVSTKQVKLWLNLMLDSNIIIKNKKDKCYYWNENIDNN